MRKSLMFVALSGWASMAGAEGAGLFLVNDRYQMFWRQSYQDEAQEAARDLRDRGFDVTVAADLTADGQRAALAGWLDALGPEAGPVILHLSGHFVHGAGGAWLLPTDMDMPPSDGAALAAGLPLGAVLSVLAGYPGEALLLLGEAGTELDDARYLRPGAGPLDLPPGVTVIRGAADDVAEFVEGDIGREGLTLVAAAGRAGLTVEGFAPADYVLIRPAETASGGDSTGALASADQALWDLTQARDDAAAYRDYLTVFPDGRFAPAARQRIAAIEADPERDARLAEEALSLSRDARREIQRDLSLLGFNTRGIDGIFGPGTRGAVRNWQEREGYTASGFLTGPQIARLDAQAESRAAELEEEARQRRDRLEAEDRAYWDQVGTAGDAAGLRAYLRRYPDGLFADVAQERLDVIEAAEAGRAAERDRAAWEAARGTDTIRAYRDYLDAFPNGAFADRARARIAALDRSDEDRAAIDRARREEEALGLNTFARRLAEARLSQLGLEPGEVDGRFDRATRRALRRYQEARDLPVTGYLDQATVVRLLADGLRQ